MKHFQILKPSVVSSRMSLLGTSIPQHASAYLAIRRIKIVGEIVAI
jgi:hypothetical protein